MDEFELIQRFFSGEDSPGVTLGIGDDAALVTPTPNRSLVLATDTMVEGVHFPPSLDAADVGFRLVAANLSVMAAMAATPRWMLLSLGLPGVDTEWLSGFSSGLGEAASAHRVALVGGDTVRAPVLTLTLMIAGEVEPGRALRRDGAATGDTIYVTGRPGDAAGGLKQLEQDEASGSLVDAFRRPRSRVGFAQALKGHASAAIDVSDGLLGDLTKLTAASGRGAMLDVARLPLSSALVDAFGIDEARRLALTGGDDYELLFTASALPVALAKEATAIGTISDAGAVRCELDGAPFAVDDAGYRHFT